MERELLPPPTRIVRFSRWLYQALQPEEGWLPLLLVIALVTTLTQSIADTGWVDFDLKLQSTGLLAILVTILLAKQTLPVWRAWLLIVAYGLVIVPLRLGGWWPSIATWWDGLDAAQQFARPQFADFTNRLVIWGQRIWMGESSREVLPFALAVALLVWLCVAYLTWATFRNNQPLPALTLLGSGLAVNSYFSHQSDPTPLALYLFMAFALVALVRWWTLEQFWDRHQIDYSDELRNEFALIVGILVAVVPILSFWMPSLALAQIGGRFAESAVVTQAEDWLERAFGGVNHVTGEGLGVAGRGSGRGGAGVLPRAYLLGDAPELYETVVMTATVQFLDNQLPRNTHWRALSYDTYSGLGWRRSEAGERTIPANERLDLTVADATIAVQQQVHWLADARRIRYSLGLPLSFEEPVTTFWAGDGNLTHVRGEEALYQVQSRVSIASAEQLNTATLDTIPPLIIATYTELPDTVPDRVHQLAAEITAGAATPYAKAQAIEAFVRQYDYSLDVSAPPQDQDVADFFLFEQQAGYCDYFSTAMTVLARSVGLPARMAVGFNAQSADHNGVQTIYEINGHSWTEIYFQGYGWIEFEPTATFVNSAEDSPRTPSPNNTPAIDALVPIPENNQTAPRTAIGLIVVAALVLTIIFWLRRPLPTLTQRYARLQVLANYLPLKIDTCQTPFEFEQRLIDYLNSDVTLYWVFQSPVWQRRFKEAKKVVRATVAAFVAQQYGGKEKSADPKPLNVRMWRQVNWLLVVLRWVPRK